MKILILTHNYPTHKNDRKDAGIFIADFKSKLSKRSRVFVKKISSDKGEKFGEWSMANPLSVIRFVSMLFRKSHETKKYVTDKNVDFILAFWALPSGILAYMNYLRNKTPYAVWCLGSDLNKYAKWPILKQIISLSLKNAKIRFANSHALCESGKELTGKDFVFLPAVTDFKIGSQTKTIFNKPSDKNTYKILFVGRLESIKGPDILINSLKKVKLKTRKQILVNILGEGSQRNKLEHLVEKFGLKDIVVFHGTAALEKVVVYMRNSDVLVVPSRNESLPLVIIEAAKSKLPVIVSNVGDCKLLIDKYNAGMVFKVGDTTGLGDTLVEMGDSSEGKSEYFSGLSRMAKDFSSQKSVSTFLKEVSLVI